MILWAGAEYARLNTGGSITRGNSGNGALLTLTGKNVGNENIAPNDRAFCRIAVLKDITILTGEAEMTLTNWANYRLKFQKRSQLFIRTHNETPLRCASAIQIVCVSSRINAVESKGGAVNGK